MTPKTSPAPSTEKVLEEFEYSIEDIPVSKLDVDLAVQRGNLREHVVRSIVRGFDPLALGIGTVSFRGGDFYVLLDGWHRKEAIARLTDNQGTMRCRVLVGLSRQEEARIFLALNSGTQPTTFEKYRVGVTGDNDELVQIDKVVHAYGLTVGNTPARGNINAISTLQRVFRMRFPFEREEDYRFIAAHGVLSMTLKVIVGAWGDEVGGLQGAMLDGVSRLVERYYDSLEWDRLIEALAATKGGPAGLIIKARQYAQMRRIKTGVAMAQLLVDEYNHGLAATSKRALPSFARR